VLDRKSATTDVASTNAETTAYTFTVPGGSLSSSRALRLTLLGDYLNNSGGGSDLIVKVKWGGTSFAVLDRHTAGAASATRRTLMVSAFLMAFGATNAQVGRGELYLSTAGGVAGADAEDDLGLGAIRALHTGLAVDSSVDQALLVSIQHSVSSANVSGRLHTGQLELL